MLWVRTGAVLVVRVEPVSGGGSCFWRVCLVPNFVVPNVSCPCVVGQGGQQHDGGRYDDHEVSRHEPNTQLAAEPSQLRPGRALDAGCGEGADAAWLAGRGWQVTAVTFAAGALRRARVHTAALDPEVADRIEWLEADLTGETRLEQPYDLVSSQHVHVPEVSRSAHLGHLAAAVAPGGTLLVVGHHAGDPGTEDLPPSGDAPLTAAELTTVLDPAAWVVEVADTRLRPAVGHDGAGETVYDTVLRARRHRAPSTTS